MEPTAIVMDNVCFHHDTSTFGDIESHKYHVRVFSSMLSLRDTIWSFVSKITGHSTRKGAALEVQSSMFDWGSGGLHSGPGRLD